MPELLGKRSASPLNGNSPKRAKHTSLANDGHALGDSTQVANAIEQVLVTDSQIDEHVNETPLLRASTILARRPDGTNIPDVAVLMRSSLIELHQNGLPGLVDAVYHFELHRNHTLIQGWPKLKCRTVGLQFLAAIPSKLLSSIIRGSLASDYAKGDPDLVELYGRLDERDVDASSDSTQDDSEEEITDWQANGNIDAPCHYVRYFVDDDGLAPSPNELLQAIELMRKYLVLEDESYELAGQIDAARGAVIRSSESDTRAGLHYFLCGQRSVRRRMATRVDGITSFCNAMEQRLNLVPADLRDEPDVRAPAYVGYAMRYSRRKHEHEDNKTSYIMGLLHHAFCFLELSRYSWESFVVSWATTADEAKLGEILINGLARAYHDTGYGVAPTPAGLSCSSAEMNNKLASESAAVWKRARAFRVRRTPYKVNVAKELARYEDADKVKQARAEVSQKQLRHNYELVQSMCVDQATIDGYRRAIKLDTSLPTPDLHFRHELNALVEKERARVEKAIAVSEEIRLKNEAFARKNITNTNPS
ncbi:hypothetical protein ACN47E_004638 [Coniothyrium glycines]